MRIVPSSSFLPANLSRCGLAFGVWWVERRSSVTFAFLIEAACGGVLEQSVDPYTSNFEKD